MKYVWMNVAWNGSVVGFLCCIYTHEALCGSYIEKRKQELDPNYKAAQASNALLDKKDALNTCRDQLLLIAVRGGIVAPATPQALPKPPVVVPVVPGGGSSIDNDAIKKYEKKFRSALEAVTTARTAWRSSAQDCASLKAYYAAYEGYQKFIDDEDEGAESDFDFIDGNENIAAGLRPKNLQKIKEEIISEIENANSRLVCNIAFKASE